VHVILSICSKLTLLKANLRQSTPFTRIASQQMSDVLFTSK